MRLSIARCSGLKNINGPCLRPPLSPHAGLSAPSALKGPKTDPHILLLPKKQQQKKPSAPKGRDIKHVAPRGISGLKSARPYGGIPSPGAEQRRGQWPVGGFWPRIYVVKKAMQHTSGLFSSSTYMRAQSRRVIAQGARWAGLTAPGCALCGRKSLPTSKVHPGMAQARPQAPRRAWSSAGCALGYYRRTRGSTKAHLG
jgi:hypothetical protein